MGNISHASACLLLILLPYGAARSSVSEVARGELSLDGRWELLQSPLVVQQLGNENTCGLGGRVSHATAPWTPQLVRIYESAMAADPTRLRTPGGGDLDQGGVSAFVDYHGEPTPSWHELVPNLHMVMPKLAWGAREKPLMFSEWNESIEPTMCAMVGDALQRPDPTTMAETSPRAAYRLTRTAQAQSYAMGAAEFRKQRVPAYNCFMLHHLLTQDTRPDEAGHLLALATNPIRPIVALPLRYGHNHWADEPIRWRFFVSNDAFRALAGELVWRLSAGFEVRASGRQPVSLVAGEYREQEVPIPRLSAPAGPRRLTLHYAVVQDGQVLFQDARPLTVFPRPGPALPRIVLLDPDGATARQLSGANIAVRRAERFMSTTWLPTLRRSLVR